MRPIEVQPEPDNFNRLVREPGREFLAQVPNPSTSQWKPYWQAILPEMRDLYRKVCAYCCQWIPYGTGRHSVDHFIPKTLNPNLAYEWSNYRYVSARFNSRKGLSTILDPFQIEADWFIIDFSSYLIKSNPQLNPELASTVNETIQRLKLNEDESLIEERQEYITDYFSERFTFEYLDRRAPFIAYELRRQGYNR